MADPRFQRGFNFVRDRRELSTPEEPQGVRAATTRLKAHAARIAPCRWAVVVPAEDAVYYGMARMASILMEGSGIHFEVFRRYDAAVTWAITGGLVT